MRLWPPPRTRRLRPPQRRARARLAGGSRRRARRARDMSSRALRVFSDDELERLSTDCRGFLFSWSSRAFSRRCSARSSSTACSRSTRDELDIEQLKWVVLMVLSSQPGQEQACARMEDLVFEDPDSRCPTDRWLTTSSSSNRPPRRRPSRSTSARISRCSPPMATCATSCRRKARSIPTSDFAMQYRVDRDATRSTSTPSRAR